jgi:hypothetical protein
VDLRMPFHSQEEEEWGEGERKEVEDKYLQCNWDTHNKSDLLSKFQPSLDIKARFTSLILLRPKPPNSFGLQMESQAFRVRFLVLEAEKPHQKFLKILSSSAQKLFGSKKELIAYVGKAAATDLIRTSLPTWDKDLAFHPSILPKTLSMIPWKALIFEFPIRIGRPR